MSLVTLTGACVMTLLMLIGIQILTGSYSIGALAALLPLLTGLMDIQRGLTYALTVWVFIVAIGVMMARQAGYHFDPTDVLAAINRLIDGASGAAPAK